MIKTRIHRRTEAAFTLIELLVAVTIGLLLTIVIGNLFVGSRATYQTTDEMSRMQENIRFAYQLLSRTIHSAGYRSSPNSYALAQSGVAGVFDSPNDALVGTESGGTVPDTFTIRYQGSGTGAGAPDGSIVDCTGAEIDAGVMTTNTFSIAVGANGSNALFCNNGAAVEVVSDVDNMQILYGEDTNSDLVADRYVVATDVADFNSVVNLRVSLLFRTTNIASSVLQDTATYNLNGTVVGPFNDTRIRRVVTLNMNLRNRTP